MMKIIQFDGKKITGISIRTTNANEMNPARAKIAALYQEFDKKITVDYKNGARVYGVYYNYESDASGEYSVMAGTDQPGETSGDGIETLVIPRGHYMVFAAKGDMPQVVIDTWGKIWRYFSAEGVSHPRAYTTDFEFYKNQQEIEIHIAVKT